MIPTTTTPPPLHPQQHFLSAASIGRLRNQTVKHGCLWSCFKSGQISPADAGDQVEGGAPHNSLHHVFTCSVQLQMCLASLIRSESRVLPHGFHFTHVFALRFTIVHKCICFLPPQVDPDCLSTSFYRLGHSLHQTLAVSVWGKHAPYVSIKSPIRGW